MPFILGDIKNMNHEQARPRQPLYSQIDVNPSAYQPVPQGPS